MAFFIVAENLIATDLGDGLFAASFVIPFVFAPEVFEVSTFRDGATDDDFV